MEEEACEAAPEPTYYSPQILGGRSAGSAPADVRARKGRASIDVGMYPRLFRKIGGQADFVTYM
jgi:hypothetical protein